MQNDSIVITAKLNVDASEGLILKDLEKIQGDLRKKPLQINCAISDTALKNMQDQLSSMAKGLTIDVGKVNAQAIQQSITEATKSQPVNITTKINKAEIKRQAEEIKNSFGLIFPKDEAKALDAELRKILTDFDSAFKSSNAKNMQSNLEKLTDLCFKYDSGLDETTRSMREQEEELQKLARAGKVYISEMQKGDLLNKFGGSKGEVKKYLEGFFGVGGFTYDRSKATTSWDSLASQLNERIKPELFNANASSYDDIAKIHTSDIVKGLEDFANILSQSMTAANDALKGNSATWEQWSDVAYNALMKFQGVESSPVGEFVEIFSDEQIAKTEQNVQKLAQAFHSIEAAKAAYKSDDVKSVTADWALDAERNIKGFTINVTKANGEIERLHHTIDEMGQVQLLGSNVSDRGVDKLLQRANNEADKLERKLININAAALDQNAARPIKTEEGKNAIAKAYNDAIEAVNKLRQADATTFAELDNEAKKAVDNLNNVVKAQRNAETAATKLRTKSIEIIREEELSNLNRFVADVSKSAIPNVKKFEEEVAKLREQLSKVGDNDKQGLADYLDRFSVLNSTFNAVNEQARVAASALKELDKISGNSRFAQNSQNTNVQSTLSDVSALKAEYQQLFESLGKNNAPENLQQISARLAELKPRFDAVRQSASDLNRELTDNRLSQDATKRLNNLTNQINTFANANKKAIESTRQMRSGVTFADEWKRITDTLKAGNLDDNAIRQLTADFQNFKGEARSVGNVTNTVFTNMSGQIQMLASRWLSLYAVIGKLKQMINYVIELDDAMTKLKRVTDETAEGYERFLEVAKKSAKETNTTLVDTVEQAAKWAKSGYDAATSAELAKTSLIYSIVGDIDNDTAVSDLVTALRGFRLEAEDAMSIVDKLDALNNKYATDAKSLGEALTVSASAMANAGNDLDETLALITGATEVTQNAKETGQAIRTITMRIRGKLYASI